MESKLQILYWKILELCENQNETEVLELLSKAIVVYGKILEKKGKVNKQKWLALISVSINKYFDLEKDADIEEVLQNEDLSEKISKLGDDKVRSIINGINKD